MNFEYDPNKTIENKLEEYHSELKDNKFSGEITMNYLNGNVCAITEKKHVLLMAVG